MGLEAVKVFLGNILSCWSRVVGTEAFLLKQLSGLNGLLVDMQMCDIVSKGGLLPDDMIMEVCGNTMFSLPRKAWNTLRQKGETRSCL